MPIYRRCGRCGKRITSGSKCECIKQYDREYKKQRDIEYNKTKRNKVSNAFYHSKDWKTVREQVMIMYNRIDVYMYITEREVIPAEAVHHIIPIAEDWNKRLDIDNLIPLSTKSHSKIEELYKRDKKAAQEQLRECISKYEEEFKDCEVGGGI